MTDTAPASTPATDAAQTPVTDSQLAGRIPDFPRLPGETPRAYSAFTAFFLLGQPRSHQALADKLGEPLGTIKNWASKHNWTERLQEFNSGLLQAQAQAEAERHARQAADWAARLNRFREQEWDAAQKLLLAAQCFLESFGEEDLHKMTLAQVSRALSISSRIGRSALAGAELPPDATSALSPIQQQIIDHIHRGYDKPAQSSTP
jgi:hypothetical protein